MKEEEKRVSRGSARTTKARTVPTRHSGTWVPGVPSSGNLILIGKRRGGENGEYDGVDTAGGGGVN